MRRKKSACVAREDGAIVHRTKPVYVARGTERETLVGHRCACRTVILTTAGRPVAPVEVVNGEVIATPAYQKRAAAEVRG